MKKEEAVLKINKLGNISNIIVRICKIFVVIGLVLTVLGAIVTMVLPKDLIKMDMSATAEVMVDMSSFGKTFTEEEKEAIAAGMYDGMTGEEKTEIQMTMAIIRYILPPLIFPMNSAMITNTPVCSRPPTTTKRPIKNISVL